ncbi:MAG: hypothetical protein E7B29_15345, partial [Mixta calida]|nr:hypothetical protein [Mixta calida]
ATRKAFMIQKVSKRFNLQPMEAVCGWFTCEIRYTDRNGERHISEYNRRSRAYGAVQLNVI